MSLLVHLASEKDVPAIRRVGIKACRFRGPHLSSLRRGVFAMPVTGNFYVSHQWLRELKRRGQRTLVGVYFRVPDQQTVLVGNYNGGHRQKTADEATGLILHTEQPEGFEIIVPRKIEAGEIHKIKALPQVLGWRYYPGAKGRKPCGCPYCTKGDIKSKRIRRAYEESWKS